MKRLQPLAIILSLAALPLFSTLLSAFLSFEVALYLHDFLFRPPVPLYIRSILLPKFHRIYPPLLK